MTALKRDQSCLIYIFPALVALLLSGIFLLLSTRLDIHLFINQHHWAWADVFFKYSTHLGDGTIFAVAILLAIFKDLRSFFAVGFTGLLVLLTTGVCKNLIFKGLPRPSKFYEHLDLYYVPGVELHAINSFPSGHTMAAFGVYMALSCVLKNHALSILFFILSVLVGYSRMYLSQHFLVDVFAGGILGLICAMLALKFTEGWQWKYLNLNLIKIIRK